MPNNTEQAIDLMSGIADRTGLGGGDRTQRYLWTDAFALVNALHLWNATGRPRWRDYATTLITQVHEVLGRHRPDDPRQGWLSGLSESEGARHPTRGGLRIGKPLPERGPDEPINERLEWDRDGQYWHYLTKWMDALSRAAVFLNEPRYQRHAEELAAATLPHFLRKSEKGQPLGLAWKMSVDLSRPQVAKMSAHDVLDGYVTFRWLGRVGNETGLDEITAILQRLAKDQTWETGDPLGLGGLLLDAVRLALLPDRNADDKRLIETISANVDIGLEHFLRSETLDLKATHRLGFRELGLSTGLQGLPAISAAMANSGDFGSVAKRYLDGLANNAAVGRRIIDFWSDPVHHRATSWTEHRDINEVMLATALLDAFVGTAIQGRDRH